MKKVIDLEGNEIEVSEDTIVKTINGKHYLLNDDELAELEQRQSEWEAGAHDRAMNEIRSKRNALLAECDWRVLPDQPFNQAWADYREALRDLPATVNVENPVYPTKPKG